MTIVCYLWNSGVAVFTVVWHCKQKSDVKPPRPKIIASFRSEEFRGCRSCTVAAISGYAEPAATVNCDA